MPEKLLCGRCAYPGGYQASFKHGILTLNIPKKEAKQVESKKYIAIEG